MIELLKIICKFSKPAGRIDAAAELAQYLHAESILFFQFDDVVNAYLPGNGFPQTIRNAKHWQEFLIKASKTPTYYGEVGSDINEKRQVVAISSEDCIIALIGFSKEDNRLEDLECMFSLVASLLKVESKNQDLQGKLRNLQQSSIKSEQLAQHLDKAREQLQNALKTEEEFLSIASHELKTPITSINAFVDLLLQSFPETKDKQVNYFLTRVKSQVQRLLTLIKELLDVTKIKAGKLELVFSEVQLKDLMDEMMLDFSSSNKSHIIINNDIPDMVIRCDKNRIEQVISNLLANAVKYSPGTDTILLNVTDHPENIQIDIQDFGIGIAEKNQGKVFDKFFREHSGDTGMLSSLGLGLYICADIVRRHDGKIWVDSNIDKGTTFHFTLPKYDDVQNEY